MWDANRSMVDLEQHTQPAGVPGISTVSSLGCEECLRHLMCYGISYGICLW